jgi:hypothetical protein
LFVLLVVGCWLLLLVVGCWLLLFLRQDIIDDRNGNKAKQRCSSDSHT